MNDSQQLREQMWDLVYGLLTPEESQSLIARVKSDPQAARLYAEVRLQADLVGQAARIEDPDLVFQIEPASKAEQPTPAQRPAAAAKTRRGSRTRQWLVGIAATALAALLSVGVFWPEPNRQQLAANRLVTEVSAPRSMQAGVSRTIAVKTYPVSLDDSMSAGAPAEVDVAIVNAANEVKFKQSVRTDKTGRGEVEVPGQALQPGVRLEVAGKLAEGEERDSAARGDNGAVPQMLAFSTPLNVEPEPYATYFVPASPVALPGEEQELSAWILYPVSKQPAVADISRVTVHNVDGAAVAEPMWRAEGPVVNFGVKPPPGTSAGDLTLHLRNSAGVESQARLGDFYEGAARADSSAGALARSRSEELRKDLAFGGRPEEAKKSGEAERLDQAKLKQLQPYFHDSRQPSTALAKEAAIPEIVSAGQPASVSVPAAAADKSSKLLAVVTKRGLFIASQELTANPQPQSGSGEESAKSGERTYSVALPPEADGEIEVAILDRSTAPPQVVGRQRFYREPSRKLNIAVADGKERFAPGEQVQLTLQFTDENGVPAAGTHVAVRLWNEKAIRQAGEPPVMLDEVVRGRAPQSIRSELAMAADKLATPLAAGEERGAAPARAAYGFGKSDAQAREKEIPGKSAIVETVEPQPAANKELKDDKNSAPKNAAASLALNPTTPARALDREQVEGYLSLSETPTADDLLAQAPADALMVVNNREQVTAEYRQALDAAQQRRRTIVAATSGIALGGILLLLLVMAIAYAARLPSRRRVYIPLALAAASLLVGLMWMGRGQFARHEQVAMTPGGVADSRFDADYTTQPADRDAPLPMSMPTNELSDLAASRPAEPAGSATQPAENAPLAKSFDFGNAPSAPPPKPAPSAAPAPVVSFPPPVAAGPPATEPRPQAPAEATKPSGDGSRPGIDPAAAPAPPASPAAAAPTAPAGNPSSAGNLPAREPLESFLRPPGQVGQGVPAAEGDRSAARRMVAESASGKADEDKAKVGKLMQRAIQDGAAKEREAALSKDQRQSGVDSLAAGAAASASTLRAKTAAGGRGGAAPGGGGTPDDSGPAGGSLGGGRLGGGFGGGLGGGAGIAGRGVGIPGPVGQQLAGEGRDKAEGGERLKESTSSRSSAPPALYFNPQLVTDANGRVTIEFTMPEGETEYRLLVDALGNGRIGSKQQTIVGTKEAK